MTLTEFLAVVNAEVLGQDVWRKEDNLIWLALGQGDQHRASVIVNTDERIWAVELFPEPGQAWTWVDPNFDVAIPGSSLTHRQCLELAREIMPDDTA